MSDIPDWHIVGDWFDNCSCAVACPCTFAQAPDNGFCESVLFWHVREGHYGDVKLDNLSFVRVGRKRCESTVGSARIDGPGPREQFGEAAIGPVVDELGQHVGEVGLWVDAVQLARLDQRGEHRPVFRPFATAGE
jgi:hypothetical protein